MLRISVMNGAHTTRFKVEGKLAHEWVFEAEKAWAALSALHEGAMNGVDVHGRHTGKGKRVVVDLLDVSFVDGDGRKLLAEMHHAGAQLLGSGPMISALIEEIQRPETEDVANSSNDNSAQPDSKVEVER